MDDWHLSKKETVVVCGEKYIILMIDAKCLVAFSQSMDRNATIVHMQNLLPGSMERHPLTRQLQVGSDISISAGMSSNSEFIRGHHRMTLLALKC
jgi:hypothetical protein